MAKLLLIPIFILTYLVMFKLLFRDWAEFAKRGRETMSVIIIALPLLLVWPQLEEHYPEEFSWKFFFWSISGLAIGAVLYRILF